jgi:nicotinic acid mononucleotide adenylyltransferase
LPEVSSTAVRQLLERFARGEAVADELGALVPKAVLGYISEHALYRG